ncbi:MAG: NAD-dependent epimerase/dehydratase family protein [Candidatus Eisenbacteria bacterium]|nr:NAD-dependent epimerase/dehydratase family protein [Candidatus Eisenbacteria bacterium]
MNIVLVTGAAGFIGSHVARKLIESGTHVRAVDAFTNYYGRAQKESNVADLRGRDGFELIEADLSSADPAPLLDGVDAVCHLAAQAGVRDSWGADFDTYIDCNIRSTQRLLEAARDLDLSRFVYASSSSVYGETEDLPMREDGRTCPVSPYGVTKLAAEHLAVLYHRSYGVPTVSLRYFTVYGPGQRPDMAFHRFIRAALADEPITIYGDGEQTRDFTYVDDIVAGTVAALTDGPPGTVFNLGGGSRVSLNRAVESIENALGTTIRREYTEKARGDVTDTLAANDRARHDLGFAPGVTLDDGIRAQCAWMRSLVASDQA